MKNPNKPWKRAIIAAIIAATTLIMGCGQAAPADKTVRVILDYLPNTNHTGLYVALKKGYYKEEGLSVEIVQPSEGTSATLVATGKGEFGVAYQEDVTYARTADEPLPVKAIATILQRNDSGFAAIDPDIKSPKDFEGKIYGGWGAPGESAVLKACMEAAGADFDKLTVMTLQNGDLLAAMQAGEVDLGWIFEGWDGLFAKQAGLTLSYMPLRELYAALDYYTPILIASESLIADDPELVKSFLRATARGYKECADNPEGSAAILAEYAPEYELDMLVESQKHLAGNLIGDAPRWGEMKGEVWDAYTGFMVENGLIDRHMPANEAFTNEYLPS